MPGFKRSFFGYRRKEVDQYFADLDKEHQAVISEKQAELAKIRELNEKLEIEMHALSAEIETLNQNKLYLLDSLNRELAVIDSQIEDARAEVQARSQAAMQELRQKRDEVLRWYTVLQELHENLESLYQGFNGRLT